MSKMKGGCLCENIHYELLTEPRATRALMMMMPSAEGLS